MQTTQTRVVSFHMSTPKEQGVGIRPAGEGPLRVEQLGALRIRCTHISVWEPLPHRRLTPYMHRSALQIASCACWQTRHKTRTDCWHFCFGGAEPIEFASSAEALRL